MGCRQAAITRAIPHTGGPALAVLQARARERRQPLLSNSLAET
jgi:hypothetical protein